MAKTNEHVVWPPKEERQVIEAERILNEIQTNARASHARGDEEYIIDYTRLSLLLRLAMPLVPSVDTDFLNAANALAEVLPECAARSCIENICGLEDFNRDKMGGIMRLFREARWHEHGRPCVKIDAKLAAGQMASDVSEEMLAELDDLRAPWPSFVIKLPESIIMRDAFGRRYASLAVHRYIRPAPPEEMIREMEANMPEELRDIAHRANEGIKALAGPKWGLYLLTEDGIGGFQEEATLAQLMGKRDRTYLVAPEEAPPAHGIRLMEAAARLAAGVCILIHDSKGLRKVSNKKKGENRWRLSKLPQTTEYIVGGDVKVSIDCREAVCEYISGERSAMPKIQWLVRGHWRWQTHGPNHSLRRRQFIEPYWKGPERAPILARQHVVSDDE